MNQSLLKFNLFGIPVHIDFSYLLLCFIWGTASNDAISNTALLLVITIAILGHELGHALVLRHLGIMPRIHLVFWGGETIWTQQVIFHRTWGLLLNAAGIVVNILLAAIAFGINQSGIQFTNPFLHFFFTYLFWVNVILAVINLLPILPLDGGKIFHTLSGYFLSEKKSVMVTVTVSFIVATIMSLFCFFGREIFGAVLFGFFAFDNYRKMKMLSAI